MNIVVLNGSPKGDLSISMAYFKYIQSQFPNHNYKTFHVGQMIKKIEKKPAYFSEIISEIRSADGLIWVAPVYTFVVPSQLMRFIELIFENKVAKYFKGKYATTITTSAHFFDHTAHNYLHGISEDLKMNYRQGYSADMQDLLKPEGRRRLLQFAEHYFQAIKERRPSEIKYGPVTGKIGEYKPEAVETVPESGRKRIVLLTDVRQGDVNLNRMIAVFNKVVPNPVEVINLNEMNIKGGCLGCIKCGYENKCIYTDDVQPVYEGRLMTADAIVFAGAVRHRFLSARWKMLLDRWFYNGHCPKLQGRKAGFLISGPLRQNANLRQILEGRLEIWKLFETGFVTDEYKTSAEITTFIKKFAEDLIWAVENDVKKPETFLGVGGRKIFRDLVYKMKFVFWADHQFYKVHDHYDFPQKELKLKVVNTVFPQLMKVPSFRKKMQQDMTTFMVKPFERFTRK